MKKQEVDEKYKVNSTKGGSLVNPVSYKGDVMVQVWMDSRVLATLCKWLESEGEYPRFLSHVVRMPLEMLAEHLVEKGDAKIVDSTLDARALLEGRFHVSLNKGKKGMKNLLHNVTLSSRRGVDSGGEGEGIDYTRYGAEPIKEGFEEQRDRWRKEQAAKKLEMEKVIERDKVKARNSGLVVEDNSTPVAVGLSEKNRQEILTELTKTYHKLETIEEGSHMKLSREEVIAKCQAEQKGEIFEVDLGPVVKEDMTDEEYEIMIKDRAKRDQARLELENAPFEASDLPIVDDDKGE